MHTKWECHHTDVHGSTGSRHHHWDLPQGVLFSVRQDPYLKGQKLADPNFDKPGWVDILLGVDVLPRALWERRLYDLKIDYSVPQKPYADGWYLDSASLTTVFIYA